MKKTNSIIISIVLACTMFLGGCSKVAERDEGATLAEGACVEIETMGAYTAYGKDNEPVLIVNYKTTNVHDHLHYVGVLSGGAVTATQEGNALKRGEWWSKHPDCVDVVESDPINPGESGMDQAVFQLDSFSGKVEVVYEAIVDEQGNTEILASDTFVVEELEPLMIEKDCEVKVNDWRIESEKEGSVLIVDATFTNNSKEKETISICAYQGIEHIQADFKRSKTQYYGGVESGESEDYVITFELNNTKDEIRLVSFESTGTLGFDIYDEYKIDPSSQQSKTDDKE